MIHEELDVSAFGLEPLYPAQERFVMSEATNALFIGGRGSGKSVALTLRVIREACRNPGGAIGLFAPTFRQLTRVTERMLIDMCDAWARNTGWPLLTKHYKADHVFIINGCSVYSQSFERVDRVRGLNLGAALIDEIEVARDPEHVVSVISACVRGPRGAGSHSMSYATTPKGDRGLCRVFLENVREEVPGWHLVIARTADNPHVGPEFVERLRQTMSRSTFAQEVEAKILRPAAVVWPEFSRARHVVPFTYSGEPIAYAIDWGYSRPFASCWALVQSDGEPDRLVCFWQFCENDVPENQFLRTIYDHAASLNREPFLAAADRAIPRCNQALMRKWPSARIKTMKSRTEQDVWRGLELVRAALDPMTGPPRIAFAESLLNTASDRGIVWSMEQLRRLSRDGVLLDERVGNSEASHASDAVSYLVRSWEPTRRFDDGGDFYSGTLGGIGTTARRVTRRV